MKHMTDIYSKQKRSQIMSLIRSQGNMATEIKLIRLMKQWKIGGWRRHQNLPGRPDFAFPKQRVLVFVDGCFWHGCPLHFRTPKSNSSTWRKRIQTNVSRDKRISRSLRSSGWRVLRIWQHDLRGDSQKIRARINRALGT